MRWWERAGMEISFVIALASGLAYGYFKYFHVNPDPFAVVGHPWEPVALHLHVLSAPALVFFLALVLRGHALFKITMGVRECRGSGMLILWSFVAATVSGYLLQVAADPLLTKTLVWTHIGSGLLMAVSTPLHIYVLGRAKIRERRRQHLMPATINGIPDMPDVEELD